MGICCIVIMPEFRIAFHGNGVAFYGNSVSPSSISEKGAEN